MKTNSTIDEDNRMDGMPAIPDKGPYEWTLRSMLKEITSGVTSREFRMWGFLGPWGSGKSTLLCELSKRLSDSYRDKSRFACLEVFDAWNVRHDSNISLAILAHLIEPQANKNWFDSLEPSRFRELRAALLTALSTFSRAARGVGVKDIAEDQDAADSVVWGEWADLHRHAVRRVNREKVNEALSAAEDKFLEARGMPPDSRLVVAVDNLDRCSPAKLVEVLESLHNFHGLRRVRFLLVGDEHALVEAIRSRYPTLSIEGAKAYLEKIVSPVYRMPDLSADPVGLGKILSALGVELCARACKESAGIAIDDRFLGHISRFVFRGNPRKALHMFRSLPGFVAQWSGSTFLTPPVDGYQFGLVLRWIFAEYCPEFARDALAFHHRVKDHIRFVDLSKSGGEVPEACAHAVRQLADNLPDHATVGLRGPGGVVGAAALVVCRSQFVADDNGSARWKQMVDWLAKS